MRKILICELLKGIVAFLSCFLFFSLLPFSIFVLLLPVDLLGWWLVKNRMSNTGWIGLSVTFYIAVFFFAFIWIMSGRPGLEFLLDLDVIRRRF